jgi:hypothetical protein
MFLESTFEQDNFKEIILHSLYSKYKSYSFVNVTDALDSPVGETIIKSGEDSDLFRVRFNYSEMMGVNMTKFFISNIDSFIRRMPLMRCVHEEISKVNSFDFYNNESFLSYVRSLSKGVSYDTFYKFKTSGIREDIAPHSLISFGYNMLSNNSGFGEFTDDSIFDTSLMDEYIGVISSINNVPLYFFNTDSSFTHEAPFFILAVKEKKPIYTIEIVYSNLMVNSFEKLYSINLAFRIHLHKDNIVSKINLFSG